ncbi:sugar ABC transporter ATP-binding protein [Marinicrinis sediminis]|uniref:Sugar ABC transporter ATP-binding protein n=1 Tax=Marinicrinis sediminis TaxID=1652465 RepID=A0ABW5RFB7_9BACL
MRNVLQMKAISKHFPGVKALQHVDFQLKGGEIHALIGANGAGKSTLMKILAGAYRLDEGQILLNDQPITIHNPMDAKRAGIACVYQEVDTALIADLTVAENIMLDDMSAGKGLKLISWKQMHQQAAEVLDRIGYPLATTRKVSDVSLSDKQMILIARALIQKAGFIIFDEPTAPLSMEEADKLFVVMNQLKQEGVGSIFISHRLPEIFELCNRITVMRDGKRISTHSISQTSIDQVVEEMLGREMGEEFEEREQERGEVCLELKQVHSGARVQGVDLTVHRGEIVGVIGFVGAGKTELARVLAGADKVEQGEYWLSGKSVRFREPADAIQAGVVMVPEERRKQGILVQEDVNYNLTLPALKKWTRWGWMKFGEMRKHSEQIVRTLNIKTPHVMQKLNHLSGGNQQKVVVGKWLPVDADVYVFDEPTKGVDIGARKELYKLIQNLAADGKAIVYLSSEFQEILGISDRIVVMCDGKQVKEFQRGEATQDQLAYYASAGEEHTG